MSNDFEIVESTRGGQMTEKTSDDRLKDSLADNMGNMIELAQDIMDIKKMQIQSQAVLDKMAEDRKMLIAEAEAYALRKNTDTKSVVERMRMVQDILRDFYKYNQTNESALSGDEFTKIISDILNTMER